MRIEFEDYVLTGMDAKRGDTVVIEMRARVVGDREVMVDVSGLGRREFMPGERILTLLPTDVTVR